MRQKHLAAIRARFRFGLKVLVRKTADFFVFRVAFCAFMPCLCERSNAVKMNFLLFQPFSGIWVFMHMFSGRKTFQIFKRVVVWIPVLVMDVKALRDRTIRLLINVSMQVCSASFATFGKRALVIDAIAPASCLWVTIPGIAVILD